MPKPGPIAPQVSLPEVSNRYISLIYQRAYLIVNERLRKCKPNIRNLRDHHQVLLIRIYTYLEDD